MKKEPLAAIRTSPDLSEAERLLADYTELARRHNLSPQDVRTIAYGVLRDMGHSFVKDVLEGDAAWFIHEGVNVINFHLRLQEDAELVSAIRRGGSNRTCEKCGAPFRAAPSAIARKQGKFCGWDCKSAAERIYPDKRTAMQQHRRMRDLRKRAVQTLGVHTWQEWQTVLSKHNGRCANCGSADNIERDHIVPLARGGTDHISNIQPLCRTCNRRKWAK